MIEAKRAPGQDHRVTQGPIPAVYEPLRTVGIKPTAAGAVLERDGSRVHATVHVLGDSPSLITPDRIGLPQVSMNYKGQQPPEVGYSNQAEHVVSLSGPADATERSMQSLAIVKPDTITVRAEGASVVSLGTGDDESTTVLRVYSSFLRIQPHMSENAATSVRFSVNKSFRSGITDKPELEATYRGTRAAVFAAAEESFNLPPDKIMELQAPAIVQAPEESIHSVAA